MNYGFLILPMFCLASGHAAASTRCPMTMPPPTITVITEDGGVSDDHSRTGASLEALGGEGPGVKGLRLATFGDFIEVRSRSWPMEGYVCTAPLFVHVTIRLETAVYIDARYPEGSCQYDAIRAHEYTHVRIDRETYDEWFPRIRDSLTQSGIGEPFPASDPDSGRTMLMDAYKGIVEATLSLMERQASDRNAQIDTPRSYAAVAAQCLQW